MLDNKQLLLENNAMVLSNVNELAAAVIMKVAGNNIANTIDGKPIAGPELRAAIAARQKSFIGPYLKG